MRISQVPIVKAIAVSTGYRATLERQNPRHIRQILHACFDAQGVQDFGSCHSNQEDMERGCTPESTLFW